MTRTSVLSWAWSLVRLDITGVLFAAVFFCLSLTPSLLPRDWVMGGIIGGINGAIGYGIGVLLGAVLRVMAFRGRDWWPVPRRWRYTLNTIVVVVSVGASLLMVVPAAAWQRQVAALMGIEGPATSSYLRTVVVALGVAALLIAVARLVKDTIRALARLMIRQTRSAAGFAPTTTRAFTSACRSHTAAGPPSAK